MTKNTLASAYAAALRPSHDRVQSTVAEKSHSAATAASAVLMAAVRRSLESCRDPAQLRMLQAFAPAVQH